MAGPSDVAELQKAAQAMGMRYEHTEPGVPLWAELVPVVELFTAMQTQWVTDAKGRASLNYLALPLVERRIGISPRRARAMFLDLRVMEAEGRKAIGAVGPLY